MTKQDLGLDLKDRKILAELDFNARAPLSEIAKKVGLSKQAVDYRIKALMRNGIIEGFYPVINSPKLGYIYCRIFVQFKSLEPAQEKGLTKYVFGTKNLFWALSLGGTYDYLFAYWVRDLTEFRRISLDFQEKFGGIMRSRLENVVTNVIHLSNKFLAPNKEVKRFDLAETGETTGQDAVDVEVMKALSLDARTSLMEMSQKTLVPPKVISYRIKRLERKGIIAGYRPIINYAKLGLTYFKVFFNLNLNGREEFAKFEEYLLNSPNVIYIVHGIAMPGDIDVELIARSNTEFFDFIRETKNRFPKLIADYQYLIYTRTIKVNYVSFY